MMSMKIFNFSIRTQIQTMLTSFHDEILTWSTLVHLDLINDFL